MKAVDVTFLVYHADHQFGAVRERLASTSCKMNSKFLSDRGWRMDGLLDLVGVWLARAYALYGMIFLLAPAFFFVDLLLLAVVVGAVSARFRQRVVASVHRWCRLAVEIAFGLINPLLYLAIFAPSSPGLRPGPEWWRTTLQASAWILLAAFWTLRLFGAALDPRSRAVRAGVRGLLWAALGCVLVYSVKDAWLLARMDLGRLSPFTFALNVLRLCPLYLIPAVLLWDYIRSAPTPSEQAPNQRHGLLLLSSRAARAVVTGVAGIALLTLAVAAHRQSEAAVRSLVRGHRESIHAAAERYDVDPRLIAAIVYVSHRDHLSPFRDAIERLVISAWATNLRRDFRQRPPDQVDQLGTDENPLLNRSLDISVGLAQIKPRTAQTASVLATGRTPDDLPKPSFYSYMDVEPAGDGWAHPAGAPVSMVPSIPVPAERHEVAKALLDDPTNLATCALILALYQNQWEATNREWSLRDRPDILATLYQIGFARSMPHGAPRSNAFGTRVRQVHEQPWLNELLATRRPPG